MKVSYGYSRVPQPYIVHNDILLQMGRDGWYKKQHAFNNCTVHIYLYL
jgi:hypothetical protein